MIKAVVDAVRLMSSTYKKEIDGLPTTMKGKKRVSRTTVGESKGQDIDNKSLVPSTRNLFETI